jgi:hypothetical protein
MAGYLADGFSGNYLPEMQGMTDIQQRQFQNQMNQQVGGFNRQAGRSNLQSGGAYLGNRAKMGVAGAQGMQDIATQNMYKNAVYAMQDRQRKEGYAQQKSMAEDSWRRQMEMYNMQQQNQQQNALWGGVGSMAGMAGSALLNTVLPGSGGMTQQLLNMFLGGGNGSNAGSNSPAVPNNATGYNSNGVQSYIW